MLASILGHSMAVNGISNWELGWKPKVNWKDLVEIMMTAELSNFEEQINWPELVTRNI